MLDQPELVTATQAKGSGVLSELEPSAFEAILPPKEVDFSRQIYFRLAEISVGQLFWQPGG